MVRVAVFLFLFFATGCHLGTKDETIVKMQQAFDTGVVTKLPIYDSLVTAILANTRFFKQQIDERGSYRACKYRPYSDQSDVLKQLPLSIAPQIDYYFKKLGKAFIYGFDVFSDSTIKLCIRNSSTGEWGVTREENLSYYPVRSNIRRRESPISDTILNEHWLYWIRLNKPRFF